MSETDHMSAQVARIDDIGMITIRAEFSDANIATSLESSCGIAVPDMRGVTQSEEAKLIWMSPDELLWVGPSEQTAPLLAKLERGLAGVHHLAQDMSHARALFRISGNACREVIAKGAPVDLSPEVFGSGQVRRTRLGQVACAFWMSGEAQFDLVCFASVAGFVNEWLENASKPNSFPKFY